MEADIANEYTCLAVGELEKQKQCKASMQKRSLKSHTVGSRMHAVVADYRISTSERHASDGVCANEIICTTKVNIWPHNTWAKREQGWMGDHGMSVHGLVHTDPSS